MIFFASLGAASLSALLLIWVGYPVAVWVFAKLAADPIRPDYARARSTAVTVVLATRESAQAIVERVANLFDTEHAAELLQVVVALDTEGTTATAKELSGIDPRVVVVQGDHPGGKACALNAGVRHAIGEVLVMTDTAQRFDRRTIPELVAHLQDDRFGAVSGALVLGSKGRLSPVDLYWRLEKWLRYNESLLHSSIGVTGAVYAIRRHAWPVLPQGVLLDDLFVPMSLILQGTRIGFSTRAMARDVRVFDAAAESNRKARTLTGVLQLNALLPQVLTGENPVRAPYVLHKLARLATPVLVLGAVLAGSAVVLSIAVQHPVPAGVSLLILTAMVLGVSTIRRAALAFLLWGWSLQSATMRAIWNARAGRWEVWHGPGSR